MAVITEDVRARVVKIVGEILEVDHGRLTETAVFAEEFDADSVLAIEILTAIEDDLDVTIDQAEVDRMVNLAGIYDVLAEA
jgi:acyl carrier protein